MRSLQSNEIQQINGGTLSFLVGFATGLGVANVEAAYTYAAVEGAVIGAYAGGVAAGPLGVFVGMSIGAAATTFDCLLGDVVGSAFKK